MSIARYNTSLTNLERDELNAYFSWLIDLIDIDETGRQYWFLTMTLYNKEFYWVIDRDANRAEDGKALRKKFKEDISFDDYDIIEGPCSVLEMLIALAARFDGNGSIDYDDRVNISENFWEMIVNLGLDMYDDGYFNEDEVDNILTIWMDRDFKYDGYGSIFPLDNPQTDQRQVEIWYQMQSYIQEND